MKPVSYSVECTVFQLAGKRKILSDQVSQRKSSHHTFSMCLDRSRSRSRLQFHHVCVCVCTCDSVHLYKQHMWHRLPQPFYLRHFPLSLSPLCTAEGTTFPGLQIHKPLYVCVCVRACQMLFQVRSCKTHLHIKCNARTLQLTCCCFRCCCCCRSS